MPGDTSHLSRYSGAQSYEPCSWHKEYLQGISFYCSFICLQSNYITFVPDAKINCITIYMFFKYVAKGGQKYLILCSAASLFMLLNAFVASLSCTHSVSWSLYTFLMAWMAASHPARWPEHDCKVPAAFIGSNLRWLINDYPISRLITSPMPIGLMPFPSSLLTLG